jgi:hopene-associated glycosyltransferase HpnB
LIAFLALLIWLYLFFLHGKFWQSGPELTPAIPTGFPDVDIVIPARDEAETIAPVIASLLAQDYAGKFRVILVDDNSSDGTAALAANAGAGAKAELQIITGAKKPAGWSGKLWAVNQGVDASTAPVLLFADADITHDPRHLSALVARLLSPRVDMVSEMVRLNCETLPERALVPAFVYFFQMLYPFAKVNNPLAGTAAAAGGTVLIRRDALARIGGIESMKSALIDDVTLARKIKKFGPIYLGHSGLATSIRPYPEFADVFRMVSRSAFTQLNYSAILLVLTLIGLTLVWLVPAYQTIFGHGWHFLFGLIAYALGAVSFLPTLARYRVSKFWALALPLIAIFYMAATLSSALDHWRGTGAKWKNRSYGADA